MTGVAPGIALRLNANRPEPARTDDGNEWSYGRCWLWCGQVHTPVLWLGTAQTAGGVAAPFTVCGPCVQALHDAIWDHAMTMDRRAVARAAAAGGGGPQPWGAPAPAP
ncbi:hypothetical protein DVK44_12680 [Streptomyces paludis]|uniref:Uncharacterized protein n=1 Tax=Streptomyces paludis TaxID=2282738 RepID=A0A345HP01_9ACTN|nr:hypothetical protein DVK44_12680 [Streptomyces paludis]